MTSTRSAVSAVSASSPRAGFRADVEGLRAVAVGLVVLDHLLGWPRGGFVGVDVFFVISGYLITGLLLKEKQTRGRISIRDFYARRVRRIVPAATLVLVTTVLASRFVLSATRAKETAVDALWSFGFLANVRFSELGTDYFQQTRSPSAVQHYWSLSVEEQFYVFWPCLLMVVLLLSRRWGRPRMSVGLLALVVALVSFAYCVRATSLDPTGAYFSTAARAWELTLGALAAAWAHRVVALPDSVRASMSWLGLAGIAASAMVIGPQTTWPGSAAALPVVATVLVLAAGDPQRGVGARMALGSPPARYLGRISYSLYLWHWPCIVLAAAWFGRGTSWFYVFGGGLGLLLAALSFHLVEEPVRHSSWLARRPPGSRRRTVGEWYADRQQPLLAGGLALALALGWLTLNVNELRRTPSNLAGDSVAAASVQADATTGSPVQVLAGEVAASAALTQWGSLSGGFGDLTKQVAPEWRPGNCITVGQADLERCAFGGGEAKRTAVLLGDSYAISYAPAVRTALGPSWTVQVLTMGECPLPLLPTKKSDRSSDVYAACVAHRTWVAAQLRRLKPELAVAASSPAFVDRVVGGGPVGDASNPSRWRSGLLAALREVTPHAKRTVVLGGPPQTENLQECFTPRSRPADCSRPLSKRWRDVRTAEAGAARDAGVAYVDVENWFCSRGTCPAVIGQLPVHWDGSHLTQVFARRLAPVLLPHLDPAATSTGGPVTTPAGLEAEVIAALEVREWGELNPSLDALPRSMGPEWKPCLKVGRKNLANCRFGASTATKRAVVVGDSFAVAYTPTVRAALDPAVWSVQMLTMNACPAVSVPTSRAEGSDKPFAECVDHRRWVQAQIQAIRPDLVVVAQATPFVDKIVGTRPGDPRNAALWEDGLRKTLLGFKPYARRLVVLGAPPGSQNLQECVTPRSTPEDCTREVSDRWQRVATAERAAATSVGATFADPVAWFCHRGACPAVVATTPVYTDGVHLTAAYARRIAAVARPFLIQTP